MQKSVAVRKKRSTLSSLFLFTCIFLLSGCSLFSSNLSSTGSSSNSGGGNGSDATGAVVKPTPTPDPVKVKAQLLLKKMSQNDKLAQLIMVEFLGSDYAASSLQQMVAQQHVGGFLYQESDGNFQWPNNTIAGLQAFSAQATTDDPTAPLIAIDQEGGTVSKTSAFFGPTPSAEDLTLSGSPTTAYNQAQTDASQLKQLGINTNLAPVVDVGPDTTIFGSRFFSADPNTVATYAGSFIKGSQDGGIPGTLKHFPGLGSSDGVDPHVGLPNVAKSLADLQAVDFLPYKKIIQQDNPAMVMTTDVSSQALDPGVAAELSPKVLHYLRNTLNFNGVVITDGLYMEGLYNGVHPTDDQLAQTCVQAIQAGNDMVEGPSTPAQISAIQAGLSAAIQQGTLSQAQIDQSVTRILMMKIKYDIIK
ncbi:glycoside hydrolase family 3 N-terminal domain-containing protein [Dictyobacter arantiisoli]|uniref:beta-N-acetylhexosaminidase n=1 Tax=Dictyobacter arantiisoli TaxID=2014874 RepID=A0A5A5TIT3_9CHLR|nr:glycoside hydrolase family 3 N-terminal domain-containing protein [Dictyobacter arantiisoli]GCF11521.1 glycosyl hydrolase [Dictyobacter arantiisoli]